MLYIGFSIVVILDVFIYLLPPLFIGHRIIDQEFISLGIAILPVTMAFSILRYKLMNIDNLVDNTLIYTITLGLLAAMDISLVSLLINIQFFSINTPFAIAISLWVAAFVYLQLRELVQRQVKKFLKREIYDINDTSIKLGKKLFAVHNAREAFIETNVIIHDTLHPKSGNLYLYDGDSYAPMWETVEYKLPLSIDQIKNIKEATPLYKLIDAETLPDNYAGGVIVPVIGSKRIIGYYLFQDKQSDRLYDNEDIKLLNILTHQLSIVIEAMDIKEELRQKEIEEIREKERISREIHDGIGSRFVNAILLNDIVVKDIDDTVKILKHTRELKKVLTEGLADLRELIWTVEPGQNTLSNLIAYIVDRTQYLKEKEDIKTNIQISVENENIAISSSVKLNIVRIIQETLTNAIKHSNATNLNISITERDKHLKIAITDNGKGFNTESLYHSGYGLRNIKKRGEEIGAHVSITSKPGEGTLVTIEITFL